MFTVASNLTEAQRDSSLSRKGMVITTYTFEAVNTTFLELNLHADKPDAKKSFTPCEWTRQQHAQNLVEEYAEDDCGQLAKDDVTGEQGYIDDERSCFWQSRLFMGPAS